MRTSNMKYIGAISDADILINLAKVNRLEILELLFKEIIIPQYVYDVEIVKNAGRCYSVIYDALHKDSSIFRIIDRKKDKCLSFLARDIIEDKNKVIGPGESECAGYAMAMRIPIIISDNKADFKWLDEFITLTHNCLLTLCTHFGKITKDEAEKIYNEINNVLTRPSKNTFEEEFRKAMERFKENGWNEYLGL